MQKRKRVFFTKRDRVFAAETKIKNLSKQISKDEVVTPKQLKRLLNAQIRMHNSILSHEKNPNSSTNYRAKAESERLGKAKELLRHGRFQRAANLLLVKTTRVESREDRFGKILKINTRESELMQKIMRMEHEILRNRKVSPETLERIMQHKSQLNNARLRRAEIEGKTVDNWIERRAELTEIKKLMRRRKYQKAVNKLLLLEGETENVKIVKA